MREIVFFDGTCGVCNDFVIRTASGDPTGRFWYAPLGGQTAKECDVQETNSVVVLVEQEDTDGTSFSLMRSKAVLYLMRRQDGRWTRGIAKFLSWVPCPILDIFYHGFALMRHKLPRSGRRVAEATFAERILP